MASEHLELNFGLRYGELCRVVNHTPFPPSQQFIRLFALFNQAVLKDIADAHGLNEGVCGYVAVVLATALRARPAPVTDDGLILFFPI